MKTRLLLIPAVVFAAGMLFGCDKEDNPPAQEQTLTLTVASQRVSPSLSNPVTGYGMDYMVKYAENDNWSVFPYTVEPLFYSTGTEFVVEVEKEIYQDNGTPTVLYRMKKIVSRQKKDSQGLEDCSLQFRRFPNPTREGWTGMTVASRKDNKGNHIIRFAGTDKWVAAPEPLTGFEYEPGYEYVIFAERALKASPITDGPYARYLWMETVSKEQKDSEGIDNL